MKTDQLDVAAIDPKSLESREFPVLDSPDFRIHMTPATHEKILAHARESMRVEVCGILVGKPRRDRQGAWLEIVDVIRGEHAASQGAQVTFTHQTWDHINQQMDTTFKEYKNVGWYHTHPGFGVFLSNFDTFIHQSFFTSPMQVAFVVDPVHGEEGFFVWKQGKTAAARVFWIGNRVVVTDPRPDGGEDGIPQGTAPKKAAEKEAADPPPSRSTWADFLTLLLMMVCGGALGLWLGSAQNRAYIEALEEREVHRLVKSEVLKLGLFQEVAISVDALAQVRMLITPEGGAGPSTEKATKAAETIKQVEAVLKNSIVECMELEKHAIERMRREGGDLVSYEKDLDAVKAQLRAARKTIAETLVDKARAELAAGRKEEARRWLDKAIETWREGEDELKKMIPELTGEEK